MDQLTNMIRMQNDSINLLEGALASKTKTPGILHHLLSERERDQKIRTLTEQLAALQHQLDSKDSKPSNPIFSSLLTHQTAPKVEGGVDPSGGFSLVPQKGGMDEDCSARYGK